MDPALLSLSRASLELTRFQMELLRRVGSPDTTRCERDTIAMHLPLIAQKRRDLDRFCSGVQTTSDTFPLPPNELLAALDARSKELAGAIAASQSTSALIDVAMALSELLSHIDAARGL